MAKPRGKPFKKGQSGNPGGRTALPPEIRSFREMSYKDFLSNLQKFGTMTREQLVSEMQRPDATNFELLFGKIVQSAVEGERDARALLLDRLWGKAKEAPDAPEGEFDEMLDKISRDKITELLREVNSVK